jgi:hypothetical protein
MLGGVKRHARPSLAAKWMVLLVSLPLLGACGELTSLPSPPGKGSEPPAIPGPFENYDPARPPAFKRAPERKTKQPPRTERQGDEGAGEDPGYGGVLRPSRPGPAGG